MEHMTTQECADYLKVHVNTVKRYVHEEGLPVLRFPGKRKWVFRKDLVDAWVYENSKPRVCVNGKELKLDSNNEYGKLRVLSP